VHLALGVVGLHESEAAVVVVLVERQAEHEDGVCVFCAVCVVLIHVCEWACRNGGIYKKIKNMGIIIGRKKKEKGKKKEKET
jgi:hypothetical protein